METKKQLQKKLVSSYLILFLLFVSLHLYAQDKRVLISDDANLIISENTFFKIPGNLILGEGLSGNLIMRGNTFEITGQLDINAGSDFDITAGSFSVPTTNFDIASSVTYNGNNQEIKNWEYGNLILNGTGKMIISGDYNTPTKCNNLTINDTGNKLYIPENKAMTIENSVVNNAGINGIEIESSANGDGSIISYTSGIDATVNRYITGYRWHYLSSPINNAPLSLFNTNNFLWWDASMEWGGLGDYSPWKSYQSSNLTNVQGYAYYYYEDTIAYQGPMNVDNYTFTLYNNSGGLSDNQGWNLIGNPYTSVLDWDVAVAGGAVPAGAENAIYFFDDDGTGAQTNYRYYVPSSGGTYGVGTNDATGKIPLGQAFFIKTNTDNVTLNLNKGYRVHAIQDFYKIENENIIRLGISNESIDETLIRLVDNSTFDFDVEYDAHKMFPGNNIPQIYSILDNNVITAINSIPYINGEIEINLGFKAPEGDYSIVLKELSFFDYDVYLVDKYFNTYTNITKEGEYQFTHYGGQVENRFYLAFQNLSSDIDILNTSIAIYPNPTNRYIQLKNKSNLNFETIKISSLSGKICYQNLRAQGVNKIDLSELAEGVYFIQVTLSNGKVYQDKILYKK